MHRSWRRTPRSRRSSPPRRAAQQPTYVPKPLDLSEYKTRKLYIDTMLADAGWTEGQDWLNEVELPGMPNKSDVGYADYVLYGDDPAAAGGDRRRNVPCADVAKGPPAGQAYAICWKRNTTVARSSS